MADNRSGKGVSNALDIIGGSARLVRAAAGTAKPTEVSDIINAATSPYALAAGWTDFGATDGGITTTRSLEKNELEVDQVLGTIEEEVVDTSMTLETNLAELSLENFQIAWGLDGTIGTNNAPAAGFNNETTLGIGTNNCLQDYMIALIQDKRADCSSTDRYVRIYVYWRAQWSGADSGLTFTKGEKSILPLTFNLLVDTTETDDRNFGIILNQVV
ncbi:MAG: hypothetical protein HC798_01505 [Polaribacter sp.]|nr:hypothetical protein [Polaribacter sp.]